MSVFEFLLVLVSIIVGLGIAELLTGVARVFRGELTAGRLHSVWVLTIFVLQTQQLWSRWYLVERAEWHFLEFVLSLLFPLSLYLLSATLFPTKPQDLDNYLLARRKGFFLLLGFGVFVASVETWLVFGASLNLQDLARFIYFAWCMVLASTDRRSVQWIGGVWLLAQILFFTLLFTSVVG